SLASMSARPAAAMRAFTEVPEKFYVLYSPATTATVRAGEVGAIPTRPRHCEPATEGARRVRTPARDSCPFLRRARRRKETRASPPAFIPGPRDRLVLSADHVSFEYASRGEAFSLRDVSVHVARGSLTGVLGPNGRGKTTL